MIWPHACLSLNSHQLIDACIHHEVGSTIFIIENPHSHVKKTEPPGMTISMLEFHMDEFSLMGRLQVDNVSMPCILQLDSGMLTQLKPCSAWLIFVFVAYYAILLVTPPHAKEDPPSNLLCQMT